MIWTYYNYDGSSAWYDWGRWVLLGIIIFVAIVSFLLVRWNAIIQVRRGRQPTTGTGWMVPPSYYQSQQQHYAEAAPPYNPNISTADAGYYDEHGNFIAKDDYSQPPYDAEHNGDSYPMAQLHSDNAQPPPGPPPGHDAGPPPGPPPVAGSSQATAAEYYPPPEPPMPVKH